MEIQYSVTQKERDSKFNHGAYLIRKDFKDTKKKSKEQITPPSNPKCLGERRYWKKFKHITPLGQSKMFSRKKMLENI